MTSKFNKKLILTIFILLMKHKIIETSKTIEYLHIDIIIRGIILEQSL